MFTRRRNPTTRPEPTSPTYTWAKPDAVAQSLWVAVKAWDYKVFPSYAHNLYSVRTMFQWQGVTHTAGFEDVLVMGELEVYEPVDVPQKLIDYWNNVPANPNGAGFLCKSEVSPLSSAFLSFELYCRPAAYRSVFDAFAMGFGGSPQGVGLQITIIHPDRETKGPNYWDVSWRDDWWQVTNWEVYSGVRTPGYSPQ